MSRAIVIGQPLPKPKTTSLPSLYDTLHNSLILATVAPYLPLSSILNLAATDKAFRALVYSTPGVFRHLDLSCLRQARLELSDSDDSDDTTDFWHSPRLDGSVTEDDFYSGPLRGIISNLRRRDILSVVQTLVLDGLSVTAELCRDIINDASLNVRILSLREVTNLDHVTLRAVLRYACRKTRPDNTPKLRALYIFGDKEWSPPPPRSGYAAPTGSDWNHKSRRALSSSLRRDGDAWWARRGRMITGGTAHDWGDCMLACDGIIAFDSVVCQGPRHRNSPARPSPPIELHPPAAATFAVSACAGCGSAPEGLVHPTRLPARLPLLAPLPISSSSVVAATTPHHPYQPFVGRCGECIGDRYCLACHRWWCENCYKSPGQAVVIDDDATTPEGFVAAVKIEVRNLRCHQCDYDYERTDPLFVTFIGIALDAPCGCALTLSNPSSLHMAAQNRISKSCWECGNNCDACIDQTQRVCRKCCGGYCIIHNEGSSSSHVRCVSRGRGLGRL
ncbi:hypothetical protein L249_2541 [Ophiocordyceps polyrhachis-furcata BCC 54312]|uniref:Uncharacterized protein n=1 Tax=Ophiocordyceps polyrhachis-furcata BCC 54312 TaxID=1330021 RepID=A0A367LN94_9HYPO|nr:hypothetical protein L249_2541 [Ophiocordyceps polyrhachis-furcata BCC 54312]